MNYFAHGRLHLADPYFLAGTALPDWLGVVDRKVRVREKLAAAFVDDPDPATAALARGVVQHHQDDAWFHASGAFVETMIDVAALVRRETADEDGLRPGFLGHVLVELLLDAELIALAPPRLAEYYDRMAEIDSTRVAAAVERITGRPVDKLPAMIEAFRQSRFLFDYLEDAKLCGRLNQVMERVRLAPLPKNFDGVVAQARTRVARRAGELATEPAPQNR